MKKKLLEEFISFAKENYGISVTAVESKAPDTFSSIFGRSFLDTDLEFTTLLYSAGNEYVDCELPDATFTDLFVDAA